MNKLLAVLAVAMGLVASGVVTASAGVVITETETVISGQPGGQSPQPPRQRILMIQGNKQKMELDGGRAVITDLDKGTMDIIDGPHQICFGDVPGFTTPTCQTTTITAGTLTTITGTFT